MKEAVESLLSLGLIRKSADICEANVMTKSRRDFGITAPLCGLLSFSTIHSVVSLVLGSLFKTSYCLVTSCDVTPRMSWYYLLKDFILINSICSFQGTCLTDTLSVIRKLKTLNPLITGKNQLYGTALPCWSRLTHSSRFYPSQVSPLSPPIKMCPFYIKHSREWF